MGMEDAACSLCGKEYSALNPGDRYVCTPCWIAARDALNVRVDPVATYKDGLLAWLRKQVELAKESYELARERACRDMDLAGLQDSMSLDGQVAAYEDMLKRVRGLSEREFQVERKRGTL